MSPLRRFPARRLPALGGLRTVPGMACPLPLPAGFTGQVAALEAVVARLDALTTLVVDQHDATLDDPDAATHAYLAVDELCAGAMPAARRYETCREELFAELTGTTVAELHQLFLDAAHGDVVALETVTALHDAAAGLPDVTDALAELADARRDFLADLHDRADAAACSLERTAALWADPAASGPDLRVVVVAVDALGPDERALVVVDGWVSWTTRLAAVTVLGPVAAYLCGERGAVDLGGGDPVPGDPVDIAARVTDALDAGVELACAFDAACLTGLAAPCNQRPARS